mmetsp:Transcript_44126/g.73433  ORF Transcript_44126/g.73433 Transcript_44126/m.73433 type:complete len:80 (-) Transcript_44126:409-648(-)
MSPLCRMQLYKHCGTMNHYFASTLRRLDLDFQSRSATESNTAPLVRTSSSSRAACSTQATHVTARASRSQDFIFHRSSP